jgi:hypothetical protein
MYGAVPYLMNAFGLDRNAAFAVVCEWLDYQSQPASMQPNSAPQAAAPPTQSRARGQAGLRRRTT